MAKARILIVEDERLVARDIQERLKDLGYDVPAITSSGEETIKKAELMRPDLVLMDIKLKGDVDGIKAAEQIRNRFDIPVVYLTAYADGKTLKRAKITEPYGYILKPFEERELHSAIEIALYKHRMERKLKESERWLHTTLRSIGDGVIATDVDGYIAFINPVAEALTGWDQKGAIRRPLEEVFNIKYGETGEKIENPVEKVTQKGDITRLSSNTVLIAKDGTRCPIDDSCAPIRDDNRNIIGVVLTFSDVKERKKMEKMIETSLREKEMLLKEIHHRVKNNLQIISSMLYLQSKNAQAKDISGIFRNCQNRVKSISLIHEQLYQSSTLSKIDFAAYIRTLVVRLFRTYGVSSDDVALETNVSGAIMGIDTAIPCGLMINELVSNSLKHAFPTGKKGKIRIDLHSMGDVFTLVVSDNGAGFPKGFDIKNPQSVGLQLVNALVEQVSGKIEAESDGGTTFRITFVPAEENFHSLT